MLLSPKVIGPVPGAAMGDVVVFSAALNESRVLGATTIPLSKVLVPVNVNTAFVLAGAKIIP